MNEGGNRIRMGIDALVYLSVVLGAALLVQAFTLLPPFVAYAILGGWVAYMAAAILVFKKVRLAYPLVLVLSVLTLIVSLPQPEHYSLVNPGQALAGATFLLGSVSQIALLILIPIYLLRGKIKRTTGPIQSHKLTQSFVSEYS